jgi:hypothetical protein
MARKRQILPDRWNSYFDAFSRDHKEQAVSVEVYGEDIGKEIIVHDMPLQHLGYIRGDQQGALIISFGYERTELAHVIQAPEAIWEVGGKSGQVHSLEIIDSHDILSVIILNKA